MYCTWNGSTYHNLNDLLWLQAIHRKAIHLDDPVPCVEQTCPHKSVIMNTFSGASVHDLYSITKSNHIKKQKNPTTFKRKREYCRLLHDVHLALCQSTWSLFVLCMIIIMQLDSFIVWRFPTDMFRWQQRQFFKLLQVSLLNIATIIPLKKYIHLLHVQLNPFKIPIIATSWEI